MGRYVGYIHQNIHLEKNIRQLDQTVFFPGALPFLQVLSVLGNKYKVAIAERGHRTNELCLQTYFMVCVCWFVPALDKWGMWPTKYTFTRSAENRNRDMGWLRIGSDSPPYYCTSPICVYRMHIFESGLTQSHPPFGFRLPAEFALCRTAQHRAHISHLPIRKSDLVGREDQQRDLLSVGSACSDGPRVMENKT